MQTDNKIVVYQLSYGKGVTWAHIGNFLSKLTNGEVVCIEDVKGVSMCGFFDVGDNQALVHNIWKNQESFRRISKPERLYEKRSFYENVFCIYINAHQLKDIVELQYMYLISRSFSDQRIVVIIEGTESAFSSISRLFQWVNKENRSFYESVFFHTEKETQGQMRKLDTGRVAAFGRLLPLLEINENTDRLLRGDVNGLLGNANILKLFSKDNIMMSKLDIAGSALKLVQIKQELFKVCDKDEVVNEIGKMNLLTLILYAWSLSEKNTKYKNMKEVRGSISYVEKYAQGFLQLTENILFHTKSKVGTFTFRIPSNAEYLRGKYGVRGMDNKRYFEVTIADYHGRYSAGNIAQTFLKGMEEEGQKKLFEGMMPIHFFLSMEEMDEKYRNAWKEYYDNPDHIGRHYGLKMFKTLVDDAKGRFVVESHSCRVPSDEEYVGVQKKAILCLPGTFYSILMPMDFENQYEREEETDFSIANGIYYEKDLNKVSRYSVKYFDGGEIKTDYSDEKEKNVRIEEIKQHFVKNVSENKDVIALNAEEIPPRCAELFYKAIVMAARGANAYPYIAFYGCSTDFIDSFWQVAYGMFSTMEMQYILRESKVQIALYARSSYEEMLIIPNNFAWTVRLNSQINFTRETRWQNYFRKLENIKENIWNAECKNSKVFPFDVVLQIKVDGEEKSIFEYYAKQVVSNSIQSKALGCKFDDTHMRLGSTIHVGQFYEAEVLFGINLFVEKFAYLVTMDLAEKLEKSDQLVIYGYAAYSELLVYSICSLIGSKCAKVDYAILERDIESGSSARTDRIRYSRHFRTDDERIRYFSERKIVCVIPIGSTLKTNERLINILCEDNREQCRKNILENYEIILVGNKENDYWNVSNNRIVAKKRGNFAFNPRFFLRFDMDYEESMKCKMCFPPKVLDEIPLIEVNAASTIPNQAFGICTSNEKMHLTCDEEIKSLQKDIDALAKEIKVLKDCMLYSHTKNGDVHFLFYFRTNQLMIEKRKEITEWLKKVKCRIGLDRDSYNVIFCPSRVQNVGFAECINDLVFNASAIIIRDDVNREYRSNFQAKYSNIYQFLRKIAQEGRNKKICFFYADGAIVTGRSFLRAKSLLKGIVKDLLKDTRVEYCIFDSVFVLVDRNSPDNRRMYVGNDAENHYFAFSTFHVSSLRNHGDACVLCKLEKEAEILKETSVCTDMYQYWENEQKKFAPDDVRSFVESDEYRDNIKRKRAYRRMICANDAGVFLSDVRHGNQKDEAMRCLLNLILAGCRRTLDKEDLEDFSDALEIKREYFLSYCKILSRPFVIFNKAVKEAVFDMLLVFTEKVITGRNIDNILAETDKKQYLHAPDIRKRLELCEQLMDEAFQERNSVELLFVLLKQITEMKSNYIIRLESINKIVSYIGKFEEEQQILFYKRFMTQIKKLLGVSSDTSKSAWFDYMLFHSKEYEDVARQDILLPRRIFERLFIENNRVTLDAIKKLAQIIKFTENEKAFIDKKCEISAEDELRSIITPVAGKDSGDNSEEKSIEGIKEKIAKQRNSYILKDYYAVLESHGGIDEWDNVLPIVAQIMLYQYIEQNFGDNQNCELIKETESLVQLCFQIALYLNQILRAEKTFILIEEAREVDAWEDEIIERFNSLAQKNGKMEWLMETKRRKDYLLLGSSSTEKKSAVFREKGVIDRLKGITQKKTFCQSGYYFDEEQEDEILVWKLGMQGNQDSQIYVYSRLTTGRMREEYLSDIRNAMQFSYLLNNRVFNDANKRFFDELIAGARDLSYNLGAKTISHTSYTTRMSQYEHVTKVGAADKYGGRDFEEKLRKTDIVMLLADLNISEHYRRSLKRNYYINKCEIKSVPWNTPDSLFCDGFPKSFLVPAGQLQNRVEVITLNEGFSYSDESRGKIVHESGIPEDEKLLCYPIANSAREFFLMLYLLITNSAVGGRGEVNNGKVYVYLSKTPKSEMRISNKINSDNRDKINMGLNDTPPYDEDGISIWTVSRYLKSFAGTMLGRRLAEFESGKTDITDDDILSLKDGIQRLPQEMQLRIEMKYFDGGEYFTIVLPILAEKYAEYCKTEKVKL